MRKNGSPTPDEIDLIEQWIVTGAPDVLRVDEEPATLRPFVSTEQVINTIHGHLKRLDPADRPFQRYFTLNHLHNQSPKNVPASRLRLVRGAVSKALNSLSWRFEIVVPTTLDAEQTVLAF